MSEEQIVIQLPTAKGTCQIDVPADLSPAEARNLAERAADTIRGAFGVTAFERGVPHPQAPRTLHTAQQQERA